jgi:hypothetical protein
MQQVIKIALSRFEKMKLKNKNCLPVSSNTIACTLLAVAATVD